MDINSLTNLISLRNYLNTSIENLSIKLARDEVKTIQQRVAYLDKVLLDAVLDQSFIDLVEQTKNKRTVNIVSDSTVETVGDKVRAGEFDTNEDKPKKPSKK